MRRAGGLNFNRREKKVNTGLLKEIAVWTGEILLVMVIAVMLVSLVGFRISVAGPSMEPTLNNGDEVLVNRFIYKIISPKKNDFIVFLPNGNEKSHYYVKRVIAVPGDTVQIKEDGLVYVNGELFEEEISVAGISNPMLAQQEVKVGEEEYFVLGDNRNNSEDSRYASIGNIKKEHIVGKAWFILSPWSRLGFLK